MNFGDRALKVSILKAAGFALQIAEETVLNSNLFIKFETIITIYKKNLFFKSKEV